MLLIRILILCVAWSSVQASVRHEDMDIVSDTLRYLPSKKIAIFEGSVVATQKDLKITADKVNVFLKARSSKDIDNNIKNSQMDKITLDGNVTIQTAKDYAESDRGEYNAELNILYLFDNVKLQQGKNMVFGDKLVYNRKTGESVITSNQSNRVRGRFSANDKAQNK